MDLMMIDVTNIDDVQVGDEVVLMGRDGNEEISCTELAESAGTITVGNHYPDWRTGAAGLCVEMNLTAMTVMLTKRESVVRFEAEASNQRSSLTFDDNRFNPLTV